jgi:hypothetical protein
VLRTGTGSSCFRSPVPPLSSHSLREAPGCLASYQYYLSSASVSTTFFFFAFSCTFLLRCTKCNVVIDSAMAVRSGLSMQISEIHMLVACITVQGREFGGVHCLAVGNVGAMAIGKLWVSAGMRGVGCVGNGYWRHRSCRCWQIERVGKAAAVRKLYITSVKG